jgi:hypothetical protein
LQLLTLLVLPAVFLSGCTGVVGNAPPSLPAQTSAPSITSNPPSETVTVGNTAIFVVAAAGATPLAYQWQKNGVVIPDAILPTYVTPPTRLSDDGSIFTAVVSNSVGSLMSSPAMLTVVAGTARLTANASTLSFGDVVIGSSSTMVVSLTNSGTGTATISSASIPPSAFNSPSTLNGSTVAPGQTTTLSIVFTPPNAAAFSGTITIASDAANSPISISVSGNGVASPAHSVVLAWNPSSSPDVVGYIVERGDQSGGPYTSLTSAPISVPTYTDLAVNAGQTYFYIVIAVDSAGQMSAPSGEAAVTIPNP